MSAGSVLLARDEAIAFVTLSNPGKRNALDAAMWQQLATVFADLDADETLRCVIVQGAGDSFAAGGDLAEFRDARADVASALAYHAQVAAALRAIAACRHPVVALIRGPCVGGGLEIAAACDLRIAGAAAQLGAPINRLGFSMYPPELADLLRLAGPATVRELLLEGRLLSAREAYEKGLLTRVVADAAAPAEALATAKRIAAGAPLVARWHKQWIARLQQGAPLSQEELRASFAFLKSADYAEGLAAFLEKRAPCFTGH
ncbi:MAG: enoyl-CoA hydratase-related protein [Rhodocyclaceae bacterium]|nr:enoyl-CoA hydratase-related protein [Rhodocyclaceae bacterium]